MVRVTNAVASNRRRKRLYKRAKGFVGDRKNHLRLTKNAVMTALSNNYIHRKKKKSVFRSLWITRIAIAAKIHSISYSKFIYGLKKAKCFVNRKMLADLAVHDLASFGDFVQIAKKSLAG